MQHCSVLAYNILTITEIVWQLQYCDFCEKLFNVLLKFYTSTCTNTKSWLTSYL